MRKVLIYRNELLPFSETFILSEASMLRRFLPVFAGLKRVDDGLDIEQYSIIALNSSERLIEKVKRRVFLRTGRATKFLSEIKRLEIELIHAHFGVDACAVLPIARRLNVPLLVTLHGYDIMRYESHMSAWPATRTYLRRKEELWQYASLFLCVSDGIRQHALLRGFPEKKLRLHHIGVRSAEIAMHAELRSEKIVLFVGRLVEKKGCIHLIRAMSFVEKKFCNAKLVIIGDGPLRSALEEEAKRLLKCCSFIGVQPQEAVYRWMRRASVLAVPSIRASDGDAEGLPTVMCEAQAAGLPVVTFTENGGREALPAPLRSGLPEEGDETGFAAVIKRLLENDELWQSASALGRDYVQANFNLEKQVGILEDIYEEVIRRHG